tara:strand:+ start:2222 stop:3409 length:1188 start_codon:yes stop_codon:yes gene_type:complete
MNARKNHHLFPRWLFSSVVSVAECSSSSFASALNDEESSSKHLEPSSSKNNVDTKTKKNLRAKVDELNAIHAKQALRELSLRQISQNYQPTHEENKTVRDFVYSSVSRVLFAFSITGVFGFASVDVKSLKMGTSGKSTFKNARNVFRARVMIGLATGVLGGMFEHRSVQFYKNLCVKILDVKEGESKMPGELAQILRDLDPLGEFVKDQERKRNRERLSGFRDGRERMTKTTRTITTAATVAARGAPSFKRDEEEDKEEEKQHHHHQRREREHFVSQKQTSPFFFSDVFERATKDDDDDDDNDDDPSFSSSSSKLFRFLEFGESAGDKEEEEEERRKRNQHRREENEENEKRRRIKRIHRRRRDKLRLKESERKTRIREIGAERRRQTPGLELFT